MQPQNENWQAPQGGLNPASIPSAQSPARPTSVSQAAPVSTQAPEAPQPIIDSQLGVVATDVAIVDSPSANPDEEQVVRWQATEYIHRDKGGVWYVLLTLVVVALIALAIFVFKSITFAILIPVMAAALVIYSRRPPEMLDYTLGRKGLHINDRLYPYELFKEFGLMHGDDQYSVVLVPRERFKPGVTVYFPEEVGEDVVDMLAARLPMHEAHIDMIDRVIRRLKL
jgi:hypothetical protein